MNKIRYLTAGESHGPALVGIIEGIPAGLSIDIEAINYQLARRQKGFGRGDRMKIEKDRVTVLSGLRFGKTLGSPIALLIQNRDWENWQDKMKINQTTQDVQKVKVPRPGHADLAGMIKFQHNDIRNVLERASARETAIRVAIGSIARQFLGIFQIKLISHVVQIGEVKSSFSFSELTSQRNFDLAEKLEMLEQKIEHSPVRCISDTAEKKMIEAITQVRKNKETLGGVFEVGIFNLPVGLGSYTHWDRRLDGVIAGAMMSIPAIKAVEIGMGTRCAELPGSGVHDEIYINDQHQVFRKTNHAGGIEGGMTNGETVIVKCTMKPIPTLMKPLNSVDLQTRQPIQAHKERSDVCAVPAAAVIAEAVLALVIADAFCEKFGGDSIEEIKTNYNNYIETYKTLFHG